MVHAEESDSRKVVRAIVLALFGSIALFWSVVLFSTWNVPEGIFGWNLAPNGTRLTYVSPGEPAFQAGIRAGNTIDWSTLPILGRANLGLVQSVRSGARLRVTIRQGLQQRTVTLTAAPYPSAAAQSIRNIAGLILIAIGIGLVYMRPSRMTWGFLLSTLIAGAPVYMNVWGQGSASAFLLSNGSMAILSGVWASGILMFMSRFPTDRARGPLVMLDRAALPAGIAIAALGLYVDIDMLVSALPPPRWALFVNQYLIEAALILVALGALTTAYALTKGGERQRVIPVLFTFAFYVATAMAGYIYSALYTNVHAVAVINALSAVAMLSLAVAVAHGVIRHRVLDVSFVVSRTVVYTVLTSILVGVFALIDFVSSKVLERLQIALLLEACAALAFGVWLNVLHARIERFVDRVLFRRRHLAEARLERTGRTLLHADSASFVDEALVIEPCDALALTTAALFRQDENGRYARVNARGWNENDVRSLDRGDALVVNLLAELQAIDLADVRWPHADVPAGIDQPLLAIPLVVRHDLLGFVLYGGHAGGEAIDPDEKRTLARLVDSAASAYEYLHAQTLVSQASELRAENQLLQHDQRLLREMIDALRNVSRPA